MIQDWNRIDRNLRKPEYHISKGERKKIKDRAKRDTTCIYCGVDLIDYKMENNQSATIEHIYNNWWDIKYAKAWNVALCCDHCNKSKGKDEPLVWFKKKGIDVNKVADVVRNHSWVRGKL